ncbi:uncharacterized protein LOC107676198 [Sinocyclocheilus anshuiensis]|uniref:uncharacterized protein LOC107676198 n=1 Tax=Sinocyclocheilus anshuiensis TaxID=1608454 RepID=UPI0007B8EA15|nr:PREDICTED: uncharacterized protein LOC107676198 [Sinocyclocheilus anshuiensis]
MADECHLCLLGLIFLSSLLTGTSEEDVTHVFISSGENVHLLCNNALHDCNSTTWNYNRLRDSAAAELIGLGIKKKDTESHERLILGSDCSLNINNISKEDYGIYSCRQYVNGELQGPDARVFLHILHVSSSSSSSSQTEITAGRSVTLFCQLYSYPRVSCDDWISSEIIELFWVNQTGVKLTRSDSRYQILSSSDHCIITLNTTLLNEDHNREWRCEVTHRDQVKSSVTYTVKSSVQAETVTAVIPVHITNSQDPSTTTSSETSKDQVTVISVSAAAFTVVLLAVLWLIWRKRAVKDENEDKGEYEKITMSTPAAARDNEQTDDVTYSEVSSSSKKPVKSLSDHNDTVTYAAIR